MDFTQYLTLKPTITLTKIGSSAYVISCKRYSPDTGKEIAPNIVTVDVSTINNQVTNIQAQLASLNALLADIKVLV